MSTDKFIRDAALRFLRPTAGKETARRACVVGTFGPPFRQRGAARGRLRRLDAVMAALKITDADLDRLLASYEAAHRQERPAILELRASQVERVA